jgi:hypothetical protein
VIQVVGELRKVEIEEYTRKATGEVGKQGILVVEPKIGRKNIEVYMTNQQCTAALSDWQKLRGKQVIVPVSIFFNKEYGFMKFNLLGTGKPLSEGGL